MENQKFENLRGSINYYVTKEGSKTCYIRIENMDFLEHRLELVINQLRKRGNKFFVRMSFEIIELEGVKK